jgi:Fe-S-cluster containining protein
VTECARCGDCCEHVGPNISVPDLRRRLANPYYAGHNRNQAEKLVQMLTERTGVRWTGTRYRVTYACTHFDRVGRLCTAHAERPDMCSGYPWYTKDGRPTQQALERGRIPDYFSPRCSFVADVRPLLSIVEVR